MRAIDEFVRINKIEGNVFMSFDLDEMKECDKIACGALKLECPEFILPVLFDNSTTVETMRYSVPNHFVDVESYMDEFEINDILMLYDKLLESLDACSDWYLLPSGFCFDEKHVYIDTKNHALRLMYIPDAAEEFNEQDIKHLLISLLEKCNEASGGNIQLQLYKYFYKPKFNIKEFRKMLDNYLAPINAKVAKEKEKEVEIEEEKKKEIPVVKQKEEVKLDELMGVAPKQEEKRVEAPQVVEQVEQKQEEQQEDPVTPIYRPKNRSQLSQEEIEEMVKSIYSGKTPLNPEEIKAEQEPSTSIPVTPVHKNEEESIYGPSKDANKNTSAAKKKNLFDNVFSNGRQVKTATSGAGGSGHTMLKSTSIHARYDLPKQIDIQVGDNGKFVIGRATRTGEPTGADYEFSAEITPISRIHAQITKKDGIYYIEDLGSSNGTFLNGTKLQANTPCAIEDGDKVAFAIAFSKNSIEYGFVE